MDGIQKCSTGGGCRGWAWKRWPLTVADDFRPIPRICRRILPTYEEGAAGRLRPQPTPTGSPSAPLTRRRKAAARLTSSTSTTTTGRSSSPSEASTLGSASDYHILLNNRMGMQMFDGGFLHHGLLLAATWLLDRENEALRSLWLENGSCYRLVFQGIRWEPACLRWSPFFR